MKKIIIERPGGYHRLKIIECSAPVPKDNEVLVEVCAAGVNFADIFIRLGLYKSAKEFVGWPITPGFEFAGNVLQCGRDVSGFAPDAAVFGLTRFGAYASHLCVTANQIYPVAPNSKFTAGQWAAFPAVFLTAYHGLFQNMALRAGMQILVHSAAGGVGGALVQLGKIAGCRITAVVGSSHKVDPVLALGADCVIDKSREDLWTRATQACPGGFDVVFDANGPATLKQSYRHLASSGKLVCYGFHSMLSTRAGIANYFKLVFEYLRVPRFNPLNMTQDNKSLIAFNLSYLFHRQDLLAEAMADLIKWVEEGNIKAPALQEFPFEQVADAHRALESGQTVGKLILKFAETKRIR
ncbi:zinc-binding dehydrogenase [Alkalispirochaeta odontotermitis]|nr:zinc-binding dehydrogenase [Alkalispirochaeta odontotermitis]CAB1080139.1 Alcohol dehydrogenase (EC [Olavius algarvensis Delta 1 endosymbiont]